MGFKNKFGFFFGKKATEETEDIQDDITNDESAQADDYRVEDEISAGEEPTEEITDEAHSDDLETDYETSANDEVAYCDETADKFAEENIQFTEEFADNAVSEGEPADDEPASDLIEEETQDEAADAPKEKKSFFARLKSGLEKTRNSINDKIDGVLKAFKHVDEELFEELEEALIMADVGVDTSLYIISELRKRVKEKKITETELVKGEISEIVSEMLSKNDNTLNTDKLPAVIMVIGVNGVGKTTSIGKMAARFKAEGKKVILGAADTFRAAAIDQLQSWADRSEIDLIKHEEGSDPASVVFDTIAAAKARGSDIIILDTAGRLHNKKNLMDELAKISRVIDRELPQCSRETLLVLDATTGQNAVNQAKLFSETADITGIILTKLDGSAKGGIVLAVSHEQNIPVKLVGVGEGIDDLQDFSSEDFAKALFS
ncbi:MAG: signal recognition particle-docking protein FtsY [Clostridia bacterium]|nr:signal recognition particle-docking protein FtsY [Clostridia bacterium]